MPRNSLLLLCALALLARSHAQDCSHTGISPQNATDDRVTLALKDAKSTYRIGDAIVLDLCLAFSAQEISVEVTHGDTVTDEIVLLPLDGVEEVTPGRHSISHWSSRSDDPPWETKPQEVGNSGDHLSGVPVHFYQPLNEFYRFRKRGHYSVQVVTHLVSPTAFVGGEGSVSHPGGITTNEVAFDILPMSDAEEQTLADSLVSEIRSIAEESEPLFEAVLYSDPKRQDLRDEFERERPKTQHADDLVKQLNYLTGDPSTRAKVYVFVHPEIFGHFRFRVVEGLDIAQNRDLAVTELEAAMKDPVTWDPGSIADEIFRLRLNQLDHNKIDEERLYNMHLIALTLPARTGENLAAAALHVFGILARYQQSDSPDFAAARQILITHFGDIPIEVVEPLLNSSWSYLHDPRIAPGLNRVLQRCPGPDVPICRGVRATTLMRLQELTAEGCKQRNCKMASD